MNNNEKNLTMLLARLAYLADSVERLHGAPCECDSCINYDLIQIHISKIDTAMKCIPDDSKDICNLYANESQTPRLLR